MQDSLELLLCQAGLPGYGQLAWYWLATWMLGFLLYHWQLGLQLLPIAAASLASAAVWGMPAAAATMHAEVAAGSSAGGSSGYRPLPVPVPVWPSQCAGAVLAGDCLLVALLACCYKQAGLARAMLLQLLAATPQVLAVVVVLLAGQVVVHVLCRGWGCPQQLRHASLLCRCWCVAAAGVLAVGSSGGTSDGSSNSLALVLAAAAAWVQKAHVLLIEGPLFVLHLGALLQPLAGGQTSGVAVAEHHGSLGQQQAGAAACDGAGNAGSAGQFTAVGRSIGGALSRRFPAALGSHSHAGSGRGLFRNRQAVASSATAAAAGARPEAPNIGQSSRGAFARGAGNSSSGSSPANGVSALLCCVHCLLQLLVLLFVPPGPMAAASWAPQWLQAVLVWGARVLLCGCCMQLALWGVGGSNNGGCGSSGNISAALRTESTISCGGHLHRSSSADCFDSCLSSPVGSGRSSRCNSHMLPSAPCMPVSPRCAASPSSGCCGSGTAQCSPDPNHRRRGGAATAAAAASAGVHCLDLQLVHGGPTYVSRTGSCLAPTAPALGGSSGLAAAAAARLLWQHAPYLLLLLAAFAGDSFITAAAPASAVPPGAASGDGLAAVGVAWAVRMAWLRCLEVLLVAALCIEAGLALRREVGVLMRLPQLWGSLRLAGLPIADAPGPALRCVGA